MVKNKNMNKFIYEFLCEICKYGDKIRQIPSSYILSNSYYKELSSYKKCECKDNCKISDRHICI